jgi:hypothetical protein
MEIQPNHGTRWYPAERYPYRIIKWSNHAISSPDPRVATDYRAQTLGYYKTRQEAERALTRMTKGQNR